MSGEGQADGVGDAADDHAGQGRTRVLKPTSSGASTGDFAALTTKCAVVPSSQKNGITKMIAFALRNQLVHGSGLDLATPRSEQAVPDVGLHRL